jgi:uncharacterized protein (DUF2252 family)
MPSNLVERIKLFHHDRIPALVQRKYEKMATDSFTFFRGTCHLFYEDWPLQTPLNNAPKTWICGDLHIENFGTYKGNNRLVYFDINDFDEAVLAPCTWDITRLVTSVLVGAKSYKVSDSEALALALHLLDTYRHTLTQNKALWIERDVSEGLIRELIDKSKTRKREDLLKKYAVNKADQFELSDPDKSSKHVLPITAEERKIVEVLSQQFMDHEHFSEDVTLLDVAFRIAGTGSLGLPRYILLIQVEGKRRLLDLKQARSSCLMSHLPTPQPSWSTEAQRIVTLQSRLQAIAPALLMPLHHATHSYVLRELQPSEDKVELKDVTFREQTEAIQSMAQIVAWNHLRSSGQQGSATIDELVEFAQQSSWTDTVIDYARQYSQQVEADWQEWRQEV